MAYYMLSLWVHRSEYYLVPLSKNLVKRTENSNLSEVEVGQGHFSMADGDVGRLQRRYMVRFRTQTLRSKEGLKFKALLTRALIYFRKTVAL